jgi:D-inositol-3-phosphate glycosyltransferase
MRMKICAISFHCCPFSLLGGDGSGGMNVYLRELCSALPRFPEVKMDIFTRIQNPRLREVKYFSPQARVVHLQGGPEHPLDRTRLFDFLPEFSRNLESFICEERENYDLVYSHYWLSGLVGEEIKQKFGLPLVHIYHTLAFMKERALGRESREHKSRKEAERHLAHVSEAIISSSGEEIQSLVDEYGIPSSKGKVIYPGVNKKLFYPLKDREILREMRWADKDRIILYVGRLDPAKGLMTVIEALELLKKRDLPFYSQLKLIIVGGGRKKEDLPENKEFIRIKESIREKDLVGKVIFLGSKKQGELKKYYSAAETVVVPSLYESFGLVPVEAMACGTPALVSRIGEMRNIIQEGKNGFSFCPNNPYSLAHWLEHFFLNKASLWNKERIRHYAVKNFSWEKTAEETYSLFRRLRREETALTTIFQPGESPQPV